MKFCSNCGHSISFGVVENEHLPRFYCQNCGTIHYQNPKIIVGCLPVYQGKIMLCRRGIEPQRGFWNIPGGFMENNESVEAGATREMYEETGVTVRIIGLHSVYSVVQVNQVHLHFLVEVLDPDNAVLNDETTEIAYYTEGGDFPWDDIAFASNRFAIERYFEDVNDGKRQIHIGSYEGGF